MSHSKILNSQMWENCIFSGEWITSNGGTYTVKEPANGRIMTTVGHADAEDIARACQSAEEAQLSWARLGAREKATIFRRAAELFRAHFDELADYVARESGGILPKGQHEVKEAVEILYHASELASAPRGEILQSLKGGTSLAKRVPRGVIGVISPFNFPLVLALRAIAPALACGNAVVTKPDPQTSISAGFMIAQVLAEAGLPKGVLHVLPGGAEAGEALCTSKHIQMIQFTGSTSVGRRVAELAGSHLKRVSVELGGNNALIVLDDVDLDTAVNNATFGAFFHQGQICMASSRIFVQASIAKAFTEKLVAKAKAMPIGDPAEGQVALGPVINEKQLSRIKKLVASSVESGATLECGGKNQGLFHEATVLSGIKPGMAGFDEESFGPIANIITFSDDEEVIKLANMHEGSLSSGVLSQSMSRALAIAEQLKSGLVHVNDQTVNDDANNPFGAPGVAGAGASVGGPADIEEYTRWQWMTIKDKPIEYPF